MKHIAGIFVICCIFIISCTKQTIKQSELSFSDNNLLQNDYTDTTSYLLKFSNKTDKDSFSEKLQNFLNNFNFEYENTDFNGNQIIIRLLSNDKIDIIDSLITSESDLEIDKDSLSDDNQILIGKKNIIVYSSRKFLEPIFEDIQTSMPFVYNNDISESEDRRENANVESIITIKEVSPLKIMLVINDNIKNAHGKLLTSFDVVDALTKFSKNYPAEANVLFQNVKGFNSYISGKEAVIQGIQPINETDIELDYIHPDTNFVNRLNTNKLLPPLLTVGSYFVDETKKNNRIKLLYNPYLLSKPLLNKIVVVSGGDKNPVVSFFLNKYDAIILTNKKDINYAMSKLRNNANISIIEKERYFIAISIKDKTNRELLYNLIEPQLIKSSVSDMNIKDLNFIESFDTDRNSNVLSRNNKSVPDIIRKLNILYIKDDPVSVLIAEKTYAILSRYKLSVFLDGVSKCEYEKRLYLKKYDISIGWVNSNITENKYEKLRLAYKWFSGELLESKRINNYKEIPLFEIKRYLLYKGSNVLWQGKLYGIFK